MYEIKRHLLILTTDIHALKGTKAYLNTKKWDVQIVDDLKNFLDYLAQKEPDFVIVCMDFPNKNIKLVPKVISERLRGCVIASATKSNLETHRKVSEAGMEFKIIPPISGPAIEKIAEKYIYKMRTIVERNRIEEARRAKIAKRDYRSTQTGAAGSSLDYKNMKDSRVPLSNGITRVNSTLPTSDLPRTSGGRLVLKATEKSISEFVGDQSLLAGADRKTKLVPTQVSCMQIETLSFSGFLVAAMGDDFPMGETFRRLVQKRLIEFLQTNGEVVHPDLDTFAIQLKPVVFLDWAREYADFLRSAIHRGNQIAFAFFPFKGIRANYQSSATPDMLSIPIQEFVGDSQVGFDVYLYLSANRKYILYTPKNSTFYGKQQERLSKRGITHLHIKRADLRELNRYKAQRYFNSIVNDFASADMSQGANVA